MRHSPAPALHPRDGCATSPRVSGAHELPAPAAIRATRARLGDRIVETPVWRWRGEALAGLLGDETEVWLKLELFQRAGSFKPRGALAVMREARGIGRCTTPMVWVGRRLSRTSPSV